MYLMTMMQDKGIPYLVKEREIGELEANSPDLIYYGMKEFFLTDKLPEEHVWLLCLNAALNATSVHEISKGIINSSLVDNRAILTRALLSGCYGIVLIHNHPSGEVSPSRKDDIVTKRLKNASEIVGVTLFDHIIMGSEKYYSYANKGRL